MSCLGWTPALDLAAMEMSMNYVISGSHALFRFLTWNKWLFKKNKHSISVAAAAKSLQSCPSLCDPIDGSPPGSPIPGILQARTLEWVAISFSNAWTWNVKVKSLSHVRLLATLWTAAPHAPLFMAFFQARVLEWAAIAFSMRIVGNKFLEKALMGLPLKLLLYHICYWLGQRQCEI